MDPMERIDLKVLMPENRRVVVIDDAEGATHEIRLFIPPAALPIIAEYGEELSAAMSRNTLSRLKPSFIKAIIKVFEVVAMSQHPFMTEEWIEKNISMARLVFMMQQLSIPLRDQLAYLTTMGLAGEQTETAGPEKEPS